MLILASASEWRQKLLAEAGLTFQIIPTDFDEEPYQKSITNPELLVKTLAQKKAETCLGKIKDKTATILAADTIVWADHQIIGKPTDKNDARRIIQLLSGTTHEVWTGVCIIQNQNLSHIFAEKSEVTFRSLTSAEIEAYLDTNDWVGKAGAYQLQRNIGKYVSSITGDPTTIIGLPVKRTVSLLSEKNP